MEVDSLDTEEHQSSDMEGVTTEEGHRAGGERAGSEREYGGFCFFFSSRRRHTRWNCDWSSDVCSSDLDARAPEHQLELVDQRDVDRAEDVLEELGRFGDLGARDRVHLAHRGAVEIGRASCRERV